jgi:hypothetical protein
LKRGLEDEQISEKARLKMLLELYEGKEEAEE